MSYWSTLDGIFRHDGARGSVNRLQGSGSTCRTMIGADISTQRQDPITMEQTSVHHISAPHIKSDVFALGYPVRRFMYATSYTCSIARPQELSRCRRSPVNPAFHHVGLNRTSG